MFPNTITRAPVTADPAMLDAMTRQDSAAANGMAPSEMKDAPSNQTARLFSRSGSEKSLRRTVVAKVQATLLIGQPRSKPIIRPRMTPRMIRLLR